MNAEEKLTKEEIESKLKDLKIELLKQTTKRKAIKKEIARLLTLLNKSKTDLGGGNKK